MRRSPTAVHAEMSLFQSLADDRRTPVFVLTGFLGSGKTTLLNRLLRSPGAADTAVIVNELGEIALDHLLVERIDGEVALLRSGCVCCAVRSDFEQTLRELLARRDEGSLPNFGRVVIETTGLADPAPLLQSVDANPLLAAFVRLGAVITTVDAVHAAGQLDRQWEARKQVLLADWLLLTMTDLAAADGAEPALSNRLRSMNPQAQIADAPSADLHALLEPRTTHPTLERAVGLLAGQPIGSRHGDVTSAALQHDRPLDWMALQQWLRELRETAGEGLLRLKGIVRVSDESHPLLLHGVQHRFHPPVTAPGLDWPAGRSALVLITRGLDLAPWADSFATLGATSTTPATPAAATPES